jgi:hypothetical protein
MKKMVSETFQKPYAERFFFLIYGIMSKALKRREKDGGKQG